MKRLEALVRDLILFAIIAVSIPLSFFKPYYGILVWTWIAFFNPHRFTWGFMYNAPVAAAIAIPTLLGCFFTKDINRQFFKRETFLLVVLWLWYTITLIYAFQVPFFQGHTVYAQAEWERVSKVLLITLVMILLVTSHERLKYLIWVTASSFGLLAIKGALFGLRTSGEARVFGPPDSFITDNNSFALAMNMSLPLLFFLARDEKKRLLRYILYSAFACGVLCVILTYSRGGLLGLVVILLAITLKSRYKALGVVVLAVTVFSVLTFAPERWMGRMGGLAHGEIDGSGQQRLVSWGTSWNFALDYPITGGGFNALPDVPIFQRYQPEPLPGGFLSSGPHSIYFQTLEEQGFVGLAIYLVLAGSCWVSLISLRRRAGLLPSTTWIVAYTHMLEISLLGFLVSGAFLGLANFDLYYQLIAMVVILKLLFNKYKLHRPPAPAKLVEAPGMLADELLEEGVAT
jgi:probable O-glycosylation ligase (exosortase A-associated)